MGTIGKALLRQIYRCAGLLLLVALVAACGGEKSDAPSQFSYDDSKPLDVQDKPTSFSTNEVRVDDISFTGPGNTLSTRTSCCRPARKAGTRPSSTRTGRAATARSSSTRP